MSLDDLDVAILTCIHDMPRGHATSTELAHNVCLGEGDTGPVGKTELRERESKFRYRLAMLMKAGYVREGTSGGVRVYKLGDAEFIHGHVEIKTEDGKTVKVEDGTVWWKLGGTCVLVINRRKRA